MTDLKCAVCLRLGDRNGLAITIANSQALCNRHFQLSDATTHRTDHDGSAA